MGLCLSWVIHMSCALADDRPNVDPHLLTDDEYGATSISADQARHHSIQAMIVPLIVVQSIQLAYEYMSSSKVGFRVDSFAYLTLFGAGYGGSISASFVFAEAITRSGTHSLVTSIGLGAGVNLTAICKRPPHGDCQQKSIYLLRHFLGYRYQRLSGLQFRVGVAPIATHDGDLYYLPEITVGHSF